MGIVKGIVRGVTRGLLGGQGQYLSLIAAPSFSGLPEDGETLTVVAGSYASPPDSISYQWYSNGIAIPGATSLTYVVASGDLGDAISVAEIAANGSFSISTSSSPRVVRTAHVGGITIGSYVIGA